jgi:hypothetical protein
MAELPGLRSRAPRRGFYPLLRCDLRSSQVTAQAHARTWVSIRSVSRPSLSASGVHHGTFPGSYADCHRSVEGPRHLRSSGQGRSAKSAEFFEAL